MKHIGWVPVCVKSQWDGYLGPWPKWTRASKKECVKNAFDGTSGFKFKFVKVFIEEKK